MKLISEHKKYHNICKICNSSKSVMYEHDGETYCKKCALKAGLYLSLKKEAEQLPENYPLRQKYRL